MMMKMFGAKVHQLYIFVRDLMTFFFMVFSVCSVAHANDYKISNVKIEGNLRIETATIEALLDLNILTKLSDCRTDNFFSTIILAK